MDIPLKSDLPLWYAAFAVLAGLIYALVLYWRNKKIRFGKGLTVLLFALRALTVAIIAFLLLSPLIRSTKRYFRKPTVVMAMDNSASVGMLAGDSLALLRNWRNLEDKLSGKYNVDAITFDEQVSSSDTVSFNGLATNYQTLFESVNQQYQQSEAAALVMVSDGIYNRGINPLYASLPPDMKLITLGVGSDVIQPDVFIRQVRTNEVVFSGNEFPVEVHVQAEKAKGERTTLRLTKNGREVAANAISIDKATFAAKCTFYLKAEGEGVQRFKAILSTIDKEDNTINNSQDFYIEVVDEQSEILILAHAPHPDIFSLKQAIEKRPQYKVTTALLEDFERPVTDFDFVILHQLPNNQRRSAGLLAEIFGEEVPVLFILGQQTDISFFNSSDAGVDVKEFNGQFNQALPAPNDDFSLFTLSPEVVNLLKICPPLTVPFGDYEVASSENTMLYQQLDELTTSMPLLTLSGNFQHKTAVFTGTGIWKWRIQDYLQNKSHHAFDNWVYSMARYMAIRQDKDFFRVFAEPRYPGREEVVVTAELYNASYQLVNEPDVQMRVRNAEGEVFEYLFDRQEENYRLNIGQLPEGTYTYTATTSLSDKDMEKRGAFVVTEEKLEARRTVADFSLLTKLAERNNGFFVTDDAMNQVADSLLASDRSSPVQYSETNYSPVLDIFWVLVLILSLLALEWFLRKYNGGY